MPASVFDCINQLCDPLASGGGGGGTPGGPNNSIQINNSGAFDGYASFLYSDTGVSKNLQYIGNTSGSNTSLQSHTFTFSGLGPGLGSSWLTTGIGLVSFAGNAQPSSSFNLTGWQSISFGGFNNPNSSLIVASIDEIRFGSFGTDPETIFLNSTTRTSLAQYGIFTWNGNENEYLQPYEIIFVNPNAGGGNPTNRACPDEAIAFGPLSNSATANYFYNPNADGYYTLFDELVLFVDTANEYRRIKTEQDFVCESGVCTLQGSINTVLTSGIQSGLNVVYSISGSDVLISVTNTTGNIVRGYRAISIYKRDIPV
jgi:hypothetical protein